MVGLDLGYNNIGDPGAEIIGKLLQVSVVDFIISKEV